MASQTIVSSSADRQRRYRQRQRDGLRVIKVSVYDEWIDALVDHHFLDEADTDDREKIAEAIDLFLFVLSEGAVEIDGDHFL